MRLAPAVAVLVPAVAVAAVTLAAAACKHPAPADTGITVERWPITHATPAAGDPTIDVVRFDPARYAVRVFTPAHGAARGAPAWATAFDLVGVTNAGMFHEGGEPVGLVIDRGTPRGIDNAKFGGFFVWDPVAATSPPVAVVGKTCADAALRDGYRSLVQSYRLLDCDGRAIAWQDPKQYSAAAIGTDRAGRIVLLHARGAFTMHELSIALAAHDLAGAIFLEGGPEASLVVRGPGAQLERVGSYETGFVENDDNRRFWDLPNVIGIVAK